MKDILKDFQDLNIDATVFEIVPSDGITQDYFLIPPIDYMYNYNTLLNKEVLVLQYPFGQLSYSLGNIIEINGYEFTHLASTEHGSSGSPVFVKDCLMVIGIHKSGDRKKNENYGELIGPIFKFFKNFKEDKISEDKTLKETSKCLNESTKEKKISNTNNQNKLNEMTIIYDFNVQYSVHEIMDPVEDIPAEFRIFGSNFVENNKNNCYLLIEGQQKELCTHLKFNENRKGINTLEIKLIENKSIFNMSYLFFDCISLISLPDISKWNTKNVKNMSFMFSNCLSLTSLHDISEWDVKNVINMSHLFCWCRALKFIPDISKWNTENVTNMSYLFCWCDSLKSLPDISKWDTKNVTNIRSIFACCTKIKSLPDISGWNTSKVSNMSGIFGGCVSLESLQDISKWNTSNVTDMSEMFKDCKSLKFLPDISILDTKNVVNMEKMFNNCYSLISFPNLSKWKLNEKLEKDSMFEGCNKNIIPKI